MVPPAAERAAHIGIVRRRRCVCLAAVGSAGRLAVLHRDNAAGDGLQGGATFSLRLQAGPASACSAASTAPRIHVQDMCVQQAYRLQQSPQSMQIGNEISRTSSGRFATACTCESQSDACSACNHDAFMSSLCVRSNNSLRVRACPLLVMGL